jgi:hypothetical protein
LLKTKDILKINISKEGTALHFGSFLAAICNFSTKLGIPEKEKDMI